MANGDDFDPNPPGTATAMGIGPDDPLVDWASNMKPSDLAQFVHNPQGAVQSMIDQGKPPPDHHYDQLGNPISADQAAQLDAAREAAKQQLARGLGVPPQQTAPQRFTDIPPQPGETGTNPIVERMRKNLEQSGQAQPYPPGQQPGTPPLIRPAPPVNEPTTPRPGGAAAPTIVQPPPAQVAAPAPPLPQVVVAPGAAFEPVTPPPARVATPEQAAEIEARRAAAAQAEKDKKLVAQKDEKKVEPYSGEAMSDFAKSLQGVKIPERPKLPGVGTPSVRSPVGVTPNVQNLLGLAGAGGGLPSTQAAILAKLLGRIG